MPKWSDYIRNLGTAGPATREGIYNLGFALRSELPALVAKVLRVDIAQGFTTPEKLQGRNNLGLGTMSTQGAGAVAITGGTIAGIADLAIADGGTGASTAITAFDALFKNGASVATAATLVLSTVTGPVIDLTGTTTVSAVTLSQGQVRFARATGNFRITVGASLIGNGGGADIDVATGDEIIFIGYAAGVVRFWVTRASGLPVVVSDVKWTSKAIGDFYTADDGVVGVDIPPQDGSLGLGVWVELTAGLTGSGQFNNGKLTGENVSGSAPLVLATAVVSVAGSPMNGQTIRLLNTERRSLRPGSRGTIEQDAMQRLTGEFSTSNNIGALANLNLLSGVFTAGQATTQEAASTASSGNAVAFDSGGSPGARVGDETRVKTIGIRIFRRIG